MSNCNLPWLEINYQWREIPHRVQMQLTMQPGLEMFTCSISMFPWKIKHLNYLPSLDPKLSSAPLLYKVPEVSSFSGWLTELLQSVRIFSHDLPRQCRKLAQSLWTIEEKKKKYLPLSPWFLPQIKASLPCMNSCQIGEPSPVCKTLELRTS